MGEISGRSFGFPLVAKLATLRHHKTYNIPWHRHGMPELQYVLSGALTYEFRKSPPITIPGGCFFFVPSGVEHRADNDTGAPSIRLGLQFAPAAPTAAARTPFNARELAEVFTRFAMQAAQPRRQTADGARAARTLFNLVDSGHAAENPYRLRHLVNAILVETYTAFDMPERSGNAPVAEMKRWIENHCTEQLRISDMVRMSGYSRTRLFSLFASIAGMTPIDWLIRCRIAKARRMLESSRDSITDIALSCGFSSSSYFTSTFRKYTGKTPREFRAQSAS